MASSDPSRRAVTDAQEASDLIYNQRAVWVDWEDDYLVVRLENGTTLYADSPIVYTDEGGES